MSNSSTEKIPVLKDLPKEFEISSNWGYKTAAYPYDKNLEAINKEDYKSVDNRFFYYCDICEGWIEGYAYQYEEDDLGPLCGRKGTVSSCIRCGHEIGFSGIVS